MGHLVTPRSPDLQVMRSSDASSIVTLLNLSIDVMINVFKHDDSNSLGSIILIRLLHQFVHQYIPRTGAVHRFGLSRLLGLAG